MNQFKSTFTYKLIYVFGIDDKAHKDLLKIGEATILTDKKPEELLPSSRELNLAAKARIDQYTKTAAIDYTLLYTELAVFEKVVDGKKKLLAFSDKDVHSVLTRSGIERHVFKDENKGVEWFPVDLETAKKAIRAVKEGRAYLGANEITAGRTPILFRPEQKKAIAETVARFKKSDHMLWNAKMRFGKTLTALQVAKECNFQKTIIITHRPVVSKGWFEDFEKIFYDTDYKFGSKTQGERIEDLIKDENTKFVYFASIQDLRGSEAVGGKFDKNDFEFLIEWDYVIIDEAHEGTQTKLGQAVIDLLNDHTKKPKVLELSGTPFNIVNRFNEEEIYTWDYVMEQKAKTEWDSLHFGDSNPYSGLPKLQIFTYNLDKLIPGYIDAEDSAFNFHEFFRTWTGKPEKDFKQMPLDAKVGEFIHKADVWSFLNLLCRKDEHSNYPYSTEEYRSYFRHSLWMVPGVKEAKALSALLKEHPVFCNFNIANVAGNGDEEEGSVEALRKVRNAIGDYPNDNYSITISCGRLTTGVTVPEWTAVFMLAGTFSTSASTYMQTIFRVQSPANIDGQIKESCYVFDFAPDRTLKVAAEAGKLSTRVGDTSSDRVVMGEFLNFCPIIAVDGSKMTPYNVDSMLQQLKRVYTDRVVSSGFEDVHIYNDELLKLDGLELQDFEELKKIIGVSKQTKKAESVDINKQGFTNEEYEEIQRIERKPKKERTAEELAFLEEKKKKQDNKQKAISILRGISIRIPLLIYGADIPFDQDITVEGFTELFDQNSWDEFMPTGVTKEIFNKFARYYDQDVFVAAGRQIRQTAKAADLLPPTERVKKIAEQFSKFKNPDKETVLTPWRVVNMHMSDCLGGYDFFDEKHEGLLEEPRFVDRGKVTADTFANTEAQILEINSKTGLYPLYVTYSIYRKRCEECTEPLTLEKQRELWDKTVRENVFVICKTKMAKYITQRTLCGYSSTKINAHYFEDLINQLREKPEQFKAKVLRGSYWDKGVAEMKFDAIVGNPPYQIMDGGYGVSATPVYNLFVETAKKIQPKYLSMIMPSRWFSGGKYLDGFRANMLNEKRLSYLVDFNNFRDVFPGVDLAGGVCYFLWDKNHCGECNVINASEQDSSCVLRNLGEYDVFIRSNQAVNIVKKVLANGRGNATLTNIVSARKPFGLPTNYKPQKEGVPCWFIQKIGLKFANEKDVDNSKGYLKKWKFLVPKAPIAGQTDFSKPVGFYYEGNTIIAKPGECCTESYIVAGAFESEEEVLAYKSYIFTKTVRFLLLQTVVSQDVTQRNFCFVPDLGHYKGIYTDKLLCEMWGINESEWQFIDSKIHNYNNGK